MIGINLTYCRSNDKRFFADIAEIVENNEELLIYDMLEGSLLWPLDNENIDRYKFLYSIVNLSQNSDKNIIYLCSDFNIQERIQDWKNLLSLKSIKIEALSFPLSILTPHNFIFENDLDELNKSDKTKNFITLVSSPKDFRIMTLNKFYKHDLFEYSYVPHFHLNDKDNEIQSICVSTIDDWYNKFHIEFDILNHSRFLNELDHSSLFNINDQSDSVEIDGNKYFKDVFNHFLPKESFNTCCDIVLESYFDGPIFFTEKLWKEFIFKRPFLMIGSRGMNHSLKELGFELYDEIFDYSFDLESHDITRLTKFWDQIKKYIDLNPCDFQKKLDVLQDKINYNFVKYKEWFRICDYEMKEGPRSILFSENNETFTKEISNDNIEEIKKYCRLFE